jgi:hypothetical protein
MVSDSKANPTVQTTLAESPWKNLPVNSKAKDEPAHSIAVAPPRAKRPRRRGALRDDDLSANHPKTGDPIARAAP